MRTFFLAFFLVPLLATAARAEKPADPSRAAVEKGLKRLAQGAANYTKKRECFSCHHQAMAVLALSSARRHGFKVDPAALTHQVAFTVESFRPKAESIAKGKSVPGGNTMAAYALHTLEAAGHPADDTTASLVQYLLVRQKPDGSWPAITDRPPSEGSPFTNAALGLRALKSYGPAEASKERKELQAKVDQAFIKGKNWLLKSKPATTEDKVFRLRGLVYAGASRADVESARDLLLKEQRADGSWSQLPDLAGDAYATGSVLVALRVAGVAATDPAYRKGVSFLLKTQQADGSWPVQTRSRPVQTFFDNGDPGGKSQFIRFASTGWAILALLETFPASGKPPS